MNRATSCSRWLFGQAPEPDSARPFLLIVPPLGRGPEAATAWLGRIPDIDVAIVQLPGHGQRLFEDPIDDIDETSGQLAAMLANKIPDNWAVVGHCTGVYLAVEMAHRLDAVKRAPVRVFLSSSRVPLDPVGPDPERSEFAAMLTAMSDEEALAHITRERLLGSGDIDPVGSGDIDPDIAAAVVRGYRAAIRVGAAYRWTHPPLRAAVEVWRGRADDVVERRHADDWQEFAGGDFDVVEFAGRREFFGQSADAAIARVCRAFGMPAADGGVPAGR